MLLSVNAAALLAPRFVPGNQWTYLATNAQGQSGTLTQTVIGPATFNGIAATEIDTTLSTGSAVSQNYEGFNAAGDAVVFGNTITGTNTTQTDIYTPYRGSFVANLVGGVTYDFTNTDTPTSTIDGTTTTGTVSDEDHKVTLLSETLAPLTVPAGTFNVYEGQDVQTTTTPNPGGPPTITTSSTSIWYAPGLGIVKIVASNGITDVLTQYKVAGDHLTFTQQPTDADPGTTIQPSIKVAAENSSNAVDTTASGSITISLGTVSGTGALSGTLTEPLVNGVATFSDLKIDSGGTYTLTASDSATPPVSPATSNKFNVSGTALTWTGAGDGVNWSDPKNWDQNVKPVNGDSLNFPAGSPLTSNNDMSALSINSIDIQGSGYNLTGNVISLTGGLTSEAGNNTYNIATTLVGSPTVDDVTGDLTIASVFSGDSLTVSGTGIDTFDQTDAYIGTTTLSAGVTIDDNALNGAFGSGPVTIGAGSSPVTIDDTGAGPAMLANDVSFQDGSTLAVDPTVNLGGNLTIGGKSTVEATGPDDVMVLGSATTQIGGSGTLTIAGEGKAQFVGLLSSDVQVVVNSGTAELDGLLDGASGSSQVTVSGGTVQLTDQTRGNGGIDVKIGTLISAPDGSGYFGTITLDSTISQQTRVVVSPGKLILGNGPLVVPAVVATNVFSYPLIDASASQGSLVTMPSAVTIQNNGSLAVLGQVAFSQSLTMSGSADLFTIANTDDVFLSSGVQGSGTLNLGGPGTTEIDGSVAATVTVNATDSATGSSASPTKVNLAATLLAGVNAAPQVVSDCILSLSSGASGNGGIELQGGSMTTDSIPGYLGTITVDADFFGFAKSNSPDIVLTSSDAPLGKGTLAVGEPSGTGISFGLLPTFGTPLLDASALAQGVTLGNVVKLTDGGTLATQGNITFTQPINISGDVKMGTGEVLTDAGSSLTLQNGVQGSGDLLISFGQCTVAGSVGAGVSLDSYSFGAGDILNLAANLLGALGGSPQFTNHLGGTVQMLPGLTGAGGIAMLSGTLQSDATNGYTGNILLEEANVLLGSAVNPLGTGGLFVQLRCEIDAPAAPQGETLSNLVTLKGYTPPGTTEQPAGATLIVTGQLTLTGVMTVSGASDRVQPVNEADTAILSGGIQGSGPLNFAGNGTTTITGDIAAGVNLIVDDFAANVQLGANLLGDAGAIQVTLQYAHLNLLRNLSGTGGIDIENGTLQSGGLPFYSGYVTIEQRYFLQNLQNLGVTTGPDLVLTSGAAPLGLGPLILAAPLANASTTIAPPLLDATGVPGGVTLNNTFGVKSGAVLNIAGFVTFSGPTTVFGQPSFGTTNPTDQLSFTGGIQGIGTLTVLGPGTTTITGSVAGSVELLTDDTFTGTLEVAAALAGANGGPNQVTVTAGILSLLSNTSGSGGISVTGGILVNSGVPLYSGAISLGTGGTIKDLDSTDLNSMGTGTLTISGGLLQNASGGAATLTNAVTVTGNATISSQAQRLKLENTVDIAGGSSLDVKGTLVINGTLSGAGTIILDGGLLGVTGSNPGFTGTVLVNSGTVQVTPLADVLGDGPLKWNLKAQGVLQSMGSIDPVLDNPLTVESGTLILEGQFTFPNGITIDSGATLEISGAGSQVVDSGPLSGGGTIVLGGGTLSTPGGSSAFTGSVQFQGGTLTPNLTVTDAGGAFTGSPFPAAASLNAPGVSATGSLQGVTPMLTYYVGTSATGTGSTTAPTNPGTYSVVAAFAGSADYTAVQSSPVTFVIAPAQDKLVFLVQPHDSKAGKLDPVIVLIENSNGKIVNSDNSLVTLSVFSGPGTLEGKVSVMAHHGVVIFDHVSLVTAGIYTLEATGGNDKPAISRGFTILPHTHHRHRSHDVDEVPAKSHRGD